MKSDQQLTVPVTEREERPQGRSGASQTRCVSCDLLRRGSSESIEIRRRMHGKNHQVRYLPIRSNLPSACTRSKALVVEKRT